MDEFLLNFGQIDLNTLQHAHNIVLNNYSSDSDSLDSSSSEEIRVPYSLNNSSNNPFNDSSDEIPSLESSDSLLSSLDDNTLSELSEEYEELSSLSEDSISSSSEVSQDQHNKNLPPYGCQHYLRRCRIVSPCCGKMYPCRLCHDDEQNGPTIAILDMHEIDRHKIEEIICTNCEEKQGISQYCKKCNTCFGLYFCKVCRLFDDVDKGQYHCDKCGICRVSNTGDQNNAKYYHCDTCNTCINILMKDNHKCMDMKDNACPICMEDLFNSLDSPSILKCGHQMHQKCFMDMLTKTTHKLPTCPICTVSLVQSDDYNKFMDDEIANTPMPDDYKDMKVNILCNDCHNEAEVPFHIIGYKCLECGSYNTRKI